MAGFITNVKGAIQLRDLKLIEDYKNNLQRYSLEQLRYITEQGVWSLGQMYSHLILVAQEYLGNVETCMAADVEQPLGKTEAGEQLYMLGDFPPIKIKLPDFLDRPSNSESKEDLIAGSIKYGRNDGLGSESGRREP